MAIILSPVFREAKASYLHLEIPFSEKKLRQLYNAFLDAKPKHFQIFEGNYSYCEKALVTAIEHSGDRFLKVSLLIVH